MSTENITTENNSGNFFDKIQTIITRNPKQTFTVLGIVIALAGGYFGYKYFIQIPKEKEGLGEIAGIQTYFKQDSFNLVLTGTPGIKSAIVIADEYSGTKAGNLANYYAGVSYLKIKDYKNAIKHLEDFSADDEIIGVLGIGLLGDAYVESGDLDKGASLYIKAAKRKKHDFTGVYFYKKAAGVFIKQKKYADALEIFETIKEKHGKSEFASDVDKKIAYLKALNGAYNLEK